MQIYNYTREQMKNENTKMNKRERLLSLMTGILGASTLLWLHPIPYSSFPHVANNHQLIALFFEELADISLFPLVFLFIFANLVDLSDKIRKFLLEPGASSE